MMKALGMITNTKLDSSENNSNSEFIFWNDEWNS